MRGTPVFVVDKMRKERKMLVRRPPKHLQPLPDMVTRYADVFYRAGIFFDKTFTSLYDEQPPDEAVMREIAGEKTGHWIGIAPFARHRGKIYPPEKMEQVIERLSRQEDIFIFLFGARGSEEIRLSEWARRYPRTVSVVGCCSLDLELALISRLDVLLSMDSANMHFASLAGTKAVSIWGATHPFAGFYGYRQPLELAVQTDLACRPCSIFGDRKCRRGDWACMTHIEPATVAEKCLSVIHPTKNTTL
jgi:ADP-heptose:LPS heptosyltransferase